MFGSFFPALAARIWVGHFYVCVREAAAGFLNFKDAPQMRMQAKCIQCG
jgi:hypothetical protein